MNVHSDDYYYKKHFMVIKRDNLYFCYEHYVLDGNNLYPELNIIKKNLNWFEAVKLVKILNKLKGGNPKNETK